jgi:hypothetical protein
MRFLLLICFALLVGPGALARSAAPEHKRYVVIYEVVVDGQGKVSSLKVDKVLDPSLATSPEDAINHPVEMDLPDAYLVAVRAFLDRRGYEPGRDKFYTYTFFDPSRPQEPDPGPN